MRRLRERPLRCDRGTTRLTDDPAGRLERAAIGGLLAMLAGLRVVYILRWRFDSDEPQHLHVVWGWTHGLVQYRDLFDNHMPLFHLASVPLLLAAGEHPSTLVAMRAALLPIFALSIVTVYAIARALGSPAVSRWTAVLVAGAPAFFLGSLEYRPDAPWTLVWLLVLAVAVSSEPMSRGRAAVLGLLLGTALALSIKTALMLLALGVAAPIAVALGPRPLPAPARIVRLAAAGVAGFVLVPGVLTCFFATRHALAALVYGTIMHNALPGLGHWGRHPLRAVAIVPAVALLAAAAYALAQAAPDPATGARRAFVLLAGGVYAAALLCLAPLLEWESALPIFPLLGLLGAPVLLAAGARLHRRGAPPPWALAALAAAAEIAIAMGHRDLRQNRGESEIALVSDVLRLTAPDDPVFDLKGETVFRPRPFFYPLEEVTQARMGVGLIRDEIPERLVTTRTHVAIGDNPQFPPRARAFLSAHYLPVGRLRVAGLVLDPLTAAADGVLRFDLPIPGRYVLLGEGGPPAGLLDGRPYDGKRRFAAGRHTYLPAVTDGRIDVVWAPALARGFVPAVGPLATAARELRAAM